MDVHYDKDTNNVNVTFELPDGQEEEEVSIDVRNNVLTVSEGNKTSSERGEGGYVNRERRYGKFASPTLVVFKLLPRACWFIWVANLRRAADLEL
jgi:HSP20 family molecular chaperone IbpA